MKKKRNGRKKKRVIESDTASIINSFLSDQNARYLGFGRANTFKTNFSAIFKTGTANQYQSIAALGATPSITAAVWMGNFSGDTVLGKTGSSIPAAIVREILHSMHSNTKSYAANEQFAEPSGFEKLEVCAVSGLKPIPYCLGRLEEYVKRGTEPALLPCTWHYVENGTIKTRYPAEYETWLLDSRYAGSIDHSSTPLTIRSPQNGYVYYFDPSVNVVEQGRLSSALNIFF